MVGGSGRRLLISGSIYVHFIYQQLQWNAQERQSEWREEYQSDSLPSNSFQFLSLVPFPSLLFSLRQFSEETPKSRSLQPKRETETKSVPYLGSAHGSMELILSFPYREMRVVRRYFTRGSEFLCACFFFLFLDFFSRDYLISLKLRRRRSSFDTKERTGRKHRILTRYLSRKGQNECLHRSNSVLLGIFGRMSDREIKLRLERCSVISSFHWMPFTEYILPFHW